MRRIAACFDRLKQEGRKALIPYLTAGDPSPDATGTLMHLLAESGADVIEIGVPFSDPVADGPVIEQAHIRARAQGVTLTRVLSIIASFREKNTTTPVIVMTYLNPVEAKGYEAFAREAREAGVDGVIAVDCPTDASDFSAVLERHEVDSVSLVAPNSSDERIEHICHKASGFIYYVSLKGVTGSSIPVVDEVKNRVLHVKEFTSLPVCVGFGIKDGETAAAISRAADGVVVGAALVKMLAEDELPVAMANIKARVQEMRAAMDAASH